MTYPPDPGARSGDPRRGPRSYGPTAANRSGASGPRRHEEPYLAGLDPENRYLRPTGGSALPPAGRDSAPGGIVPARDYRPHQVTARGRQVGPGRGDDPAPTRALPAQPGGGLAWSDVDQPTVAGYPYAPPGPGHQPPRGPLPPLPPPPGRPGGPGGGSDDRDRSGAAVIVGRVIATVLAVAVVVVAGVGWFVRKDVNSASGISDAPGSAGNAGVAFSGGLNILLVGSDSRTDAQGNPLTAEELQAVSTELSDGTNTDTMMVLHIPQGGGKATAVSLPRDTWIGPTVVENLPGPYSDGSQGDYKPNKINSFYGTAKAYTADHLAATGVSDKADRERRSNEAGRVMLTKVVQKFTGLKINHYAEVNLFGFYLLSTAIGGVPVCLNAAVDDPFSGAKFPAGQQKVEGKAALSFVRQRHGLPNGDLDRVRRQQAFLASAANQILSAGTLTSPTKLSNLIDAVKRSVIFDRNFDLFDFAAQMRSLSAGNVTFVTLPTHGNEPSADTDALATDPAEVKALFSGLDGGAGSGTTPAASGSAAPPSVDPSSVSVDVQNGAGVSGLAADVLAKAAKAGFAKGATSDFQGDLQDTTTIHYPKGAKAAAAAVKKAIGGVGSLTEDAGVAAGHVLVVAGKDLPAPGSGLRAPGAAIQAPPSTPADDTSAISAGGVGCVN